MLKTCYFNVLSRQIFRKLSAAAAAAGPAATAGATPTGPDAFHGVISQEHPVYKPEPNRYIYYVSYACPWASRGLVVRKLKKLDSLIRVVNLDPLLNVEHLWKFNAAVDKDPVMGAKMMRDIYKQFHPDYTGRFTVPVLFDTKSKTIVNNESPEIIRIFNSGFNSLLPKPTIDLYPQQLRSEIDSVNKWVFSDINSGVYKTGFFPLKVRKQEEHEANAKALFAALDKIEGILGKQRFLAGNVVTEADIRLFVTAVRLPTVYENLFKCNLKSLRNAVDYPNIYKWMKVIYQLPGVAETVKQDQIKQHFYKMKGLNPSAFVPLYNGPDWLQPKMPSSDTDFAWIK